MRLFVFLGIIFVGILFSLPILTKYQESLETAKSLEKVKKMLKAEDIFDVLLKIKALKDNKKQSDEKYHSNNMNIYQKIWEKDKISKLNKIKNNSDVTILATVEFRDINEYTTYTWYGVKVYINEENLFEVPVYSIVDGMFDNKKANSRRNALYKLTQYIALHVKDIIERNVKLNSMDVNVRLAKTSCFQEEPEKPEKIRRKYTKSSQEGLRENWTRATFIVRENLLKRLKDYAWIKRRTIKSVVNEMIKEYLDGKEILEQGEYGE